jgi:hypothetical protein
VSSRTWSRTFVSLTGKLLEHGSRTYPLFDNSLGELLRVAIATGYFEPVEQLRAADVRSLLPRDC